MGDASEKHLDDQNQSFYELSIPIINAAQLANRNADNNKKRKTLLKPSSRHLKKRLCKTCGASSAQCYYCGLTCNACRQFFKRIVLRNMADQVFICDGYSSFSL